jgi:hypothetical protein
MLQHRPPKPVAIRNILKVNSTSLCKKNITRDGQIAYDEWTNTACQKQFFNAKLLKERKCDHLDADGEATNTLNSKVTSLLGPTLIIYDDNNVYS